MNKINVVKSLRQNGYNCAQAIACAYASNINIDENTMYRLTEGYGSGLAVGSLCGAPNAMALIISYCESAGIETHGQSKAKTYKMISKYLNEFAEKNKSLNCKDIKNNAIPCEKVINDCVVMLDNYFDDNIDKQ